MLKTKVLNLTKLIPLGKISTYKQIGKILDSKAYQAIGQILSTNYDPQTPCHRVISTTGKLTGYNRGLSQKETLLKQEGIDLENILAYKVDTNSLLNDWKQQA